MTRVGWIGLGKMGLPCALALEQHGGHDLIGYDANPLVLQAVNDRMVPYREAMLDELLEQTAIKLTADPGEVVRASDVVFVAVQTPHAPDYEGVTPTPATTRDFEYRYLVDAVRAVGRAAAGRPDPLTLVVMSTVLPGTSARLLRPQLPASGVRYVYSPSFIAMGTTAPDFLNPDLCLIGHDDPDAAELVRDLYRTVHHRPVSSMRVESAELAKVAYNTFISAKIVFGNTVMELSHHVGADCDEVTDALGRADGRLMSPRYMRGGMGDGGGCHPRDNIALSHLAERYDLSYDLFGELTRAREEQTWFLANLVVSWCKLTGFEPVVLGEAYKPETSLTVGSPARLLAYDLGDCPIYDPHVPGSPVPWQLERDEPAVYVIGTKHEAFVSYPFAAGSVVIDPWGYIPDRVGLTVIRVGRQI